jgi:hypothetical protein
MLIVLRDLAKRARQLEEQAGSYRDETTRLVRRPGHDRVLAAGTAHQATDPAAAATLWQRIDRQITNAGPLGSAA